MTVSPSAYGSVSVLHSKWSVDGDFVRARRPDDGPFISSVRLLSRARGQRSEVRESIRDELSNQINQFNNRPDPPGAWFRALKERGCPAVNPFCMALLYGRGGRLTNLCDGFGPGSDAL
jgi:hypothetical protein